MQEPIERQRRHAQEARGDSRVEEVLYGEAVESLEIAEIVVGGMEDLDHAGIGEELSQRGQGGQGERIGEMAVAAVVGDLDEAEFGRIMMKAVGFGVDAERLGLFEEGDQRVDVRGGLDPQRCAHGPRLYYRVRLTHRRAKWPDFPREVDQ